MSDPWAVFDRWARRHLEDGATDDEAIERTCKMMRQFAPTDLMEARRHVLSLRSSLPPEPSDSAVWSRLDAMLDPTLSRAEPPALLRPNARRAGRPSWTQETFFAQYREARDRAGGAGVTDKEIAAKFGRELQQLRRLVRRFGRPV